MGTLRHVMLFVLVALVISGTSLSQASLVLCAGPGGHVAIEIDHGSADCADGTAVEETPLFAIEASDCSDTPLAPTLLPLTRLERSVKTDLLNAPVIAVLPPLVTSGKLSSVAAASWPVDISLKRSGTLRSVVLLI